MSTSTSTETEISTSLSGLSLKEIDGLIDSYSGNDGKSVQKWLSEFCDIANMYDWDEDCKFRFCKRCLRGPAKYFVENEIKPETFQELQFQLVNRFPDTSSKRRQMSRNNKKWSHDYELKFSESWLRKIYKNVLFDGLPVKALIDTGSYYTLIRSDCAKNLLLEPQPFSKTITGLGNSTRIEGQVIVNVEIDDITFSNVKCYVVSKSGAEPELTIGSDIITAARVSITSKGIFFQPDDDGNRENDEDCALNATYVKDLKATEEITLGEEVQTEKCKESLPEKPLTGKQKRRERYFRYLIHRFHFSLQNELISTSLKRMTKMIIVNYLTIDAYIDTGAVVSLIADTYLEFLPDGYEIHPCNLIINNSAISKGYIIAKLEIDDIAIENVKLYVLSGDVMQDKVIIGADVITQADVTINVEGVTFNKMKN